MSESVKQVWWQAPLKVFAEATGLIVVPIVVALYGGRALDRIYETEPIWFLTLTILAIVFANLAILRLAKKYLNEVDPSTRSGLSLNNNLVGDNKKGNNKDYGNTNPSLDEK